ncbi:MAG: hypothetical protein MI922_20850, partial [Bacteroidales bacterium]|nr:hypothetical protein [Bacteroidales bacterium]
MSHGKETPRQKMIGMMYLVFLAMVAINVSGEVMLAFDVIDEGLLKTLENLESTNKETLEQFAAEKQMNPTKVTSWFDKAQKVSEEANFIVEFIQAKKIAMVGADDESVQDGKVIVADLKGKDRTDAPYNVMVGENDNLAGDSLKHMLDDFRERLLNDVIAEDAEKARHSIEGSLKTDDDGHHGGEGLEHHSWSSQHFHHLPMGGVITIMSGLQINVRNAEAEALNYLYSQIDAGSFKFNKLDATVIPNSSYIIKGNEYTADVFLAASDTTAKPTIYYMEGRHVYDSAIDNGELVYNLREGVKYDTLKIVEGRGKFFRPTRGIGENFWGGLIEITGPKGNKIRKPFKRSFMVAEGSVV